MNARGILVGVLACLALAGCGESGGTSYAKPFTLPVGPTEWDANAPSWYADGILHVGDRTIGIERAELYVLGATGVYWMRGTTLMFTSAEDETEAVEEVVWSNLAASADHSVMATVDQSRGPTDRYGAHVMQVAAFDTRTGEQLYRTPDEEPDDGADLGALYPELMPMLQQVSDERLFWADTTIDLSDGSVTQAGTDDEGIEVYDGFAETLFRDGYHVGIRGEGKRRELAESPIFGSGRLSPDRSTIFDVGQWPTDAVVYDAETGEQRAIDAPWDHFTLGGWVDEDTFFGAAEHIDRDHPALQLRARRIVRCEVDTLACTPVSPVIESRMQQADDPIPFLLEGTTWSY